MLTSKERSYLKGLASNMEPVIRIGKQGLTPDVTKAVDEALEARELIKISVLNNCADDARQIADTLHERTRSDVVHVIGNKFVLFRVSRKKPVIDLKLAK